MTVEHSSNIASTLHGDDPELVLLVDPGEEGLVLVVEDTAALWPVTLHTSHLFKADPTTMGFGPISRVESALCYPQRHPFNVTCRLGSPDMKRKWSSTSCCLTA